MHFTSSYKSCSAQKFEMKQFGLKNSAIYWQALFIYYLLCTLATGDFYDCLDSIYIQNNRGCSLFTRFFIPKADGLWTLLSS